MEKKFDFSQAEDRQEFEQLPPRAREEYIGASHEEAGEIRERAHTLAQEEGEAREHDTAQSEHYQKASAELDVKLFEQLPETEREEIGGEAQEGAIQARKAENNESFLHALKEKEKRLLSDIKIIRFYDQGLKDSDAYVRWGTAQSLGSLASVNPELYAKLYDQGLKDSDADVRWGTAQSLGSYWKDKKPIDMSEEEIMDLLAAGKDDAAYALGYFYGDRVLAQGALPEHTKKSVQFGVLERGKQLTDAGEEYKKRLFETAKETKAQGLARTLAKGFVHQDYESVSNILLGELKQTQDESTAIRYLKTLIEIENPKGRTTATRLFANQEFPAKYRKYLAKKLIDEGHWDKNLGPYLNGKDESEADEILTSLISKLGLNPDVAAYQALEAPGLLVGTTIDERIKELEERKNEFENYDLDGVRRALQDENMRKIFYLIKGGEYTYALINDYSFDKFSLVLKKVMEQDIDPARLKEFEGSLAASGRSHEEARKIMGEFYEGKVPIIDQQKRNFSFFADVELGGEYEENLVRLQSVFGQELEALIDAGFQKKIPSNIEDAKNIQKTDNEKTRQIKAFLNAGKKHNFETVKKIADKCKKEIAFRVRQKKDGKESVEELDRLNTSGLLHKYLTVTFPELADSALLSEWQSHVSETLSKLEAGRGAKKSVKKELELTFLDKGKDFIRALRFADGQQCCFNSKNYDIQGGQGASDWIARLNADPLSFIADIKTKDSNVISGFIFGRMGVSPENQKPIIMLNGIYSQEKGKAVNDNILRVIEEQFAGRLGADAVAIASKHGGRMPAVPSGYEGVSDERIIAVRALKDDNRVYDDIGNVANGEFAFEGYEKKTG